MIVHVTEVNFQSLHPSPITVAGIPVTAPILKLSRGPPWITSPAEQRQPYHWGNSKGLKVCARTWEQIPGIFIIPHKMTPCTWGQPSLYPGIGRYRRWEFGMKAGVFFFKTGQLWRTILAPECPWVSCNFCYSLYSAFNTLQVLIQKALSNEPPPCMFPFLLHFMVNLRHFSVSGKIKFKHLCR